MQNTLTEAERLIITKYDLLYESRLTKVETKSDSYEADIKEIKRDLRWMLGVIVTGFVGMLGVMAHGFKWL